MSACLMCGCGRFTAILHGADRLYRTTTKQFSVVRCDECGLLRLDPTPPPEELARYYPDDYWFAPDRTAASRLQALGPDPGWVSQWIAAAKSASASGAYISARGTWNAGSGQRGRGWRG